MVLGLSLRRGVVMLQLGLELRRKNNGSYRYMAKRPYLYLAANICAKTNFKKIYWYIEPEILGKTTGEISHFLHNISVM